PARAPRGLYQLGRVPEEPGALGQEPHQRRRDATERPRTGRPGLTARATVVRPPWPGAHRALHGPRRHLSLLSMQLLTPRRFGAYRLYELPLRLTRCRTRRG